MALFRSLIRVFAEQGAFCDPSAITGINRSCSELTSVPSVENQQLMHLRAVPFTNNYIAQTHGEESMFATLFFGVLNPTTGQLCYINAGHEPLYMIDKKGVKKNLDPTGPAVGLFPNTAYDVGKIQFEPGDLLIGYTDGVTEAVAPSGEFYGCDLLADVLKRCASEPADRLCERVMGDVLDFRGNQQQDDATLLALHRKV